MKRNYDIKYIDIILITLLSILTLSCEKYYEIHHLREQSYYNIYDIVMAIESSKDDSGNYPQFSKYDLDSNPNSKRHRDILYEPQKNHYKLFIITNFKLPNEHKYAVARVDDKGIYWQENVALDEDKINNINWENVKCLASERINNPGKDVVLFTKPKFPLDIYRISGYVPW